jgi:hypothetical protein
MPDFIGKYKIDKEVCEDVIKWFNKNKKRQQRGFVGNQRLENNIKESTDIYLGGADTLDTLLKPYFEDLTFCLEKYKKQYKYSNQDQEKYIISGVNIQKYKPSGGFKIWHYENTGTKPDSIKRHLVFMTYLNTCKKAGTMFYYQNKTFECVTGKTLIWPAQWTHTHKGVISDKEIKYIITGWWSYVD